MIDMLEWVALHLYYYHVIFELFKTYRAFFDSLHLLFIFDYVPVFFLEILHLFFNFLFLYPLLSNGYYLVNIWPYSEYWSIWLINLGYYDLLALVLIQGVLIVLG